LLLFSLWSDEAAFGAFVRSSEFTAFSAAFYLDFAAVWAEEFGGFRSGCDWFAAACACCECECLWSLSHVTFHPSSLWSGLSNGEGLLINIGGLSRGEKSVGEFVCFGEFMLHRQLSVQGCRLVRGFVCMFQRSWSIRTWSASSPRLCRGLLGRRSVRVRGS
jgi:hypothetical protein